MPIRFRCSYCNKRLSIARRKAGTTVECPSCSGQVQVPEPSDSTQTAIAIQSPVHWEDLHEPTEWFRVSRRDRDEEEMDLTPMVDITFLLLIFFMVTATYSFQKTLNVPKPDPESQGVAQAPTLEELESSNIIVQVLADNSILIDDEETPLNQLVGTIRRALTETGRTELVITAAGAALHETIVAVIDAANAVGIERIKIASPTESGQGGLG